MSEDQTQTPNEAQPQEVEVTAQQVGDAAYTLQIVCHGLAKNAGWWSDLKTGEDFAALIRGDSRFGKALLAEKIALCHSELSEALEGARKGLMDDKLPHRKMLEVELADAVIRIFDLAGALQFDLAGAIVEKLDYNSKRADHKPENRAAEGGKAF